MCPSFLRVQMFAYSYKGPHGECEVTILIPGKPGTAENRSGYFAGEFTGAIDTVLCVVMFG